MTFSIIGLAHTVATFWLWYLITIGTLKGVATLKYIRLLRRTRRDNPMAFYLHAMERELGPLS